MQWQRKLAIADSCTNDLCIFLLTPQHRELSPTKRLRAETDPFVDADTDADATPRPLYNMRTSGVPHGRASPSKSASSARSSPTKASHRSLRASSGQMSLNAWGRLTRVSSGVNSLAPFTYRAVTIEALEFGSRFMKTPMPPELEPVLAKIRLFAL